METWTEPRLLLSGSWNSEGPGGSGGPPPEPPPSCRVDSLLEPPGSVSQPRSTQRVCVCVCQLTFPLSPVFSPRCSRWNEAPRLNLHGGLM